MGTVIAALITIILPIIMISFGTVNRDKKDVAIRKIAKDLGMEDAVKEIDAKRKERIRDHIRSRGILSTIRWLNLIAMAFAAVSLSLSLFPLIESVRNGQIELKYISYALTAIGLVISLIGIVVALVHARKSRQRLMQIASTLIEDD